MENAESGTIARLAAKEEIRDLVLAYSRAIDRKDFDLLETLYDIGAGDEHGCNPSGTAEEFFKIMRSSSGPALTLQHSITNHSIKVDGDRGEGEVYLIGSHVIARDDGSTYMFLLGARYLDRYIRREGEWKFADRLVVADWCKHFESEDLADAPEIAGMRHGRSSGDDPSYGYFTLIRRGSR